MATKLYPKNPNLKPVPISITPALYGEMNQKELNTMVTRGLFGYTNPLVNLEEIRLKEEMRKYLEVSSWHAQSNCFSNAEKIEYVKKRNARKRKNIKRRKTKKEKKLKYIVLHSISNFEDRFFFQFK
jgi:hypothetical protein